jgi:hypothetical protein
MVQCTGEMYLVESKMFIAVTAQCCTGKNVARSFVKEYGASSVLLGMGVVEI